MEVLEEYEEQHPGTIHLKLFPENRGTTTSRNYGLSRAQGKYVLVLDSDAYINSGALKRTLISLESASDIGLAVPRILYPSPKKADLSLKLADGH